MYSFQFKHKIHFSSKLLNPPSNYINLKKNTKLLNNLYFIQPLLFWQIITAHIRGMVANIRGFTAHKGWNKHYQVQIAQYCRKSSAMLTENQDKCVLSFVKIIWSFKKHIKTAGIHIANLKVKRMLSHWLWLNDTAIFSFRTR